MHVVIPFAAPLSEAGRRALALLPLPGLAARLARMRENGRDLADEFTCSPPHERMLARAFGWQGTDGVWPWAAHRLHALGHDPGAAAWGELTPVHWHLGTEQLSMGDPVALQLDEASSRALLAALSELFTSEGFTVRWGAPTAWFVAHPQLAGLGCASLDRVIGRNVDRWLPAQPEARLLRRLQNEAQMLLHTHPLNAEREARGLLPVNSFWLSGCGAWQRANGEAVWVDDRLRRAALAEDWAAWSEAWTSIDAEFEGRDLRRLTLCGERAAVSFEPAARSLLGRVAANWRRPDVRLLLESL